MGAGGRMSECKNVLERVPIKKPPFDISNIKKAIPPHCFKRSLIRSSYYLFRDLAFCYAFYYFASTCIPLLPHPLAYIAWPVYWFCQGCIFTGLGILAHDMGHHSFSEYEWLDDALGFIIHSALLVPYFSFKYNHRRHHAHTSSIEFDAVWVPKRKSDTLYSEVLNNLIGHLFMIIVKLLPTFPTYILYIHINELNHMWLSKAGSVVVLYTLYCVVATTSVKWLFCIYLAPLMVMGSQFVIISFLQHSHPSLPHYDVGWDWIRGALSTVDRDYGIFNNVFHYTTNAHVVHHFFTNMPHYHVVEATKAIKPILGDYYQYDDTPILKAFWRETKECVYVNPDEGAETSGVYWFRK